MSGLDDATDLLEARLTDQGLAVPELMLPALDLVVDGVPEWWRAGGNRLYAPPGMRAPALGYAHDDPPVGGMLVIGSAVAPSFQMWGRAPLVLLGGGSRFPNGAMCCGGGSTIAIGANTGSTWTCRVDARNGGTMIAGAHGIWASGVVVQTDDMHAIRDLAGTRLNAFGGTVEIGRHVWLGLDVLVMPGARIGADTVVGARSVVTGTLAANTVSVGVPARTVRSDVTWAFEDLP